MRLLHLSDLHIPRDLGPNAEGVDARAVLAQLLYDCRRLADIDLVLVSGDVADDGSREGYTDALDLVDSFARRHGAAQAWCVGNHDAREAFSAVLGTGHRDRDGQDVGRPATANACAATSESSGVRVVTLDSLVPGEVFGRIGPEQLDWLGAVLARPAAAGTVVALHHPPLSVSPEWAAASLQDAVALGTFCAARTSRRFCAGTSTPRSAGFSPGCPSGSDPASSRGWT